MTVPINAHSTLGRTMKLATGASRGAKQWLEDSRGEAIVEDASQDEEDQPLQHPIDDEGRLHGQAVSPDPISSLFVLRSHGATSPLLPFDLVPGSLRERDYTICHNSLYRSGTGRVSENRSSMGSGRFANALRGEGFLEPFGRRR